MAFTNYNILIMFVDTLNQRVQFGLFLKLSATKQVKSGNAENQRNQID